MLGDEWVLKVLFLVKSEDREWEIRAEIVVYKGYFADIKEGRRKKTNLFVDVSSAEEKAKYEGK